MALVKDIDLLNPWDLQILMCSCLSWTQANLQKRRGIQVFRFLTDVTVVL